MAVPHDALMPRPGTSAWLSSEDSLRAFLESNGVSTQLMGIGSAKTLAMLLEELRTQACFLELQAVDCGLTMVRGRQPRVLRIVEPIFIRLCWRDCVLVQEAQQLPDGRLSTRKMLLAEKKEARDGGGLLASVQRALHEELNIPWEHLQREGILQYRPDAYYFELEQIESPSYPGLPSMYRTHHVCIDILQEGLEVFRECGLPEGRAFATREATSFGTTTHRWCWYGLAAALHAGVVKFPPSAFCRSRSLEPSTEGELLEAQTWRPLGLEELPDAQALSHFLEHAGIDPSGYGTAAAKPISALLEEMRSGAASMEWCEQLSTLRRIEEPLFVQLQWRDCVLVQLEQRFRDGCARQQNSLLAKRRAPSDSDISVTALRALREELNLPDDFPALDQLARFEQEAHCSVAKKLESSSYPGLQCVCVTHFCCMQLLEPALSHFTGLGLLADEFESQDREKVTRWRWMRIEEARRAKVTGFPDLGEEFGTGESPATYKLLSSVPSNAADLRDLLEVGGVGVSAWGQHTSAFLASLVQELKSGATQLERDVRNGRIRRVLKSRLVQLTVQEAGCQGTACASAGKSSPAANGSAGLTPALSAVSFGLEEAQRLVVFRTDLACFEVVHGDSASYPGLPCYHQTRCVQFDQRCRASCESIDTCADVTATAAPIYGSGNIDGSAVSGVGPLGSEEANAYPRLLDDVLGTRRRSGQEVKEAQQSETLASRASNLRSSRGSMMSADDGFPLSTGRISIASLVSAVAMADGGECRPSQRHRSLYKQLSSLQKNLRFRMVAKEQQEARPRPAAQAVACACHILLIRNVNPLNATFHCRFIVFLEWLDEAAVGLAPGEVPEEQQRALSVPEIALQNTLATSLEVHSPLEVVNPDTGHVACKVLYQALMQMELNMTLFPFDSQRLVLVLGLRARRDRDRAIFCQFCHVDRQIRLDEWRLTGSFAHADRPDGRARVQFGVVISRAYWYYVVNVLVTLVAIASAAFAGYFLQVDPPFDRLRFGVAVLFAQTTFRLSIENKLPKVSYATAFDQYAIFCQSLVLAIMVGNVVVSMLGPEISGLADHALAAGLASLWLIGNAAFGRNVVRFRRHQQWALQQLTELGCKEQCAALTGVGPEALRQIESIKAGLRFRGPWRTRGASATQSSVRAVSVAVRVWLLHDIDPISATFECKFTVYLEWLHERAQGLPAGTQLTPQQLADMDPPEVDVHNKVELIVEEGPTAFVVSEECGQVMVCCRYHAKLQLHLNLRRFPFDSQRLPVDLTMPNEKDRDRAFIYRACCLARGARTLDEWFVLGQATRTDYTEGIAHATLEVCIQRRSMYYIVSVILVLLGISSLVFTVFVIDVDADGDGFADQGKILVPLLMTLLAFKLLIASGQIPKVAYATVFDRFMLACEAIFFLTIIVCSATLALASRPETVGSAPTFQAHAALVLLTAWVLYVAFIVLEVRLARNEGADPSGQLVPVNGPLRPTPSFEEQRKSLTSQPLPAGLMHGAPLAGTSSAVLLHLRVHHMHGVNPLSATFECEFTASLAWLHSAAQGLPAGSELSEGRLAEFQQPRLMVQNAVSCKTRVLAGYVIDSEKGHVACQIHVAAQLQVHFRLAHFPFDKQMLVLVLALPEPSDLRRHIFLEGCDSTNAAKLGGWSVLSTFTSAKRTDGVAQAVFGVRIQRCSRYYVASLVPLCLWSSFIFNIYAIDVSHFNDRGKILVAVLLVQVVAKLAVSSKLPRIARTTAFDKLALNSLALVFGIGCSTAFCCLVGKLGMAELSPAALAHVDRCLGGGLCLAWAWANAWTLLRIRRELHGPRELPPQAPAELEPLSEDEEEEPSALAEELAELRSASSPFVPEGAGGQQRQVRKRTLTPGDAGLAISLGVKVWLVSNVDPSAATFECKFHVFLDWITPEARGLPEYARISTREAGGQLDRPRVVVSNALSVMLEDCSDVQVENGETGHVSCRIQYHVRVFHDFNLRSFPFDCQRLEVALELQRSEGRLLVNSFCEADYQKMQLDGWQLKSISMNQSKAVAARNTSFLMLVERESQYYVTHIIAIFFFMTTLMFSFYLMKAQEFVKRLLDVLKIVLTQTTFRFSVEHRLPKVQHWTPFDLYVISCQAICCLIVVSFLCSAVALREPGQACMTQESEHYVLAWLAGVWVLWNVGFALHARWVKFTELRRWQSGLADVALLRRSSICLQADCDDGTGSAELTPDAICQSLHSIKPWEAEAVSSTALCADSPQVISIAFRIWLVRNVDLVSATFECKFRVFLEWLDEGAVGLPKGKKAKLPVPAIAITNALQSEVLDRSSAPEVVDSDTGHLAAQVLYRAKLRMDQEVRLFPFDCQWLAITVSLRDEGAGQSRSFFFQYCEVDGQLQLDEWQVHSQPAFSTLTKHDSPSIQDTVMCGVLIRRNARYYVVNILGMLGLISSMAFAIYTIDVWLFWERAEVFLGIFPLTVVFKLSAQGKLPRVGYSTKFDRYATSCQILFLAVVLGCMVASIIVNLPQWISDCPAPDYDEAMLSAVQDAERYFFYVVLLLWLAWNVYFTFQAWRVQRLTPLEALQSSAPIRLQDELQATRHLTTDLDINGLAPRLSIIAYEEIHDNARVQARGFRSCASSESPHWPREGPPPVKEGSS